MPGESSRASTTGPRCVPLTFAAQLEDLLVDNQARFLDPQVAALRRQLGALDDRRLAEQHAQVERTDRETAFRHGEQRPLPVNDQIQASPKPSGARFRLPPQGGEALPMQVAGESDPQQIVAHHGSEGGIALRVLDAQRAQLEPPRLPAECDADARRVVRGHRSVEHKAARRIPGDPARGELQRRLQIEPGRRARTLESPAHDAVSGDAVGERELDPGFRKGNRSRDDALRVEQRQRHFVQAQSALVEPRRAARERHRRRQCRELERRARAREHDVRAPRVVDRQRGIGGSASLEAADLVEPGERADRRQVEVLEAHADLRREIGVLQAPGGSQPLPERAARVELDVEAGSVAPRGRVHVV
jgi:hypothetical protein